MLVAWTLWLGGTLASAQAPERAPAALATARPAWAADAPAEGVVVRLLDPGAEPRARLRLAVSAPVAETVTVRTATLFSMTLAGSTISEMVSPAQVLTWQLGSEAAAPNADAVVSARIVAAALLPEATRSGPTQAAGALEPLVGAQGTARADARGRITGTSLSPPPGAAPDTRAQVAQVAEQVSDLATPLPAEPVGLGASWEVLRQVGTAGLTLAERRVVTLEEPPATEVVLQSTVEHALLSDGSELQGLPRGADVREMAVESSGGGAVTRRLDRPWASASVSEVEVRLSLLLSVPGTPPVDTTMRFRTRVEVAPISPVAP